MQRDETDQDPELQVTRRIHECEPRHDQRTRDVGADQEQTSRVAICEHAADQERRDQPERLDTQHDSERARLAREREGPPAQRDDEGRVADLGDRLPGEEEPEAAVPERLENAQARAGRGHWLHRGEAILRVCRTGSVSRAFR